MRRRALAVLSAVLVAGPALAQSPTYRFVTTDNRLQDRDAYLLTLLEADPVARRALAADPALQALGKRLAEDRDAVALACRRTAVCPVERLALTPAEIETAAAALGRLASGPLAPLVQRQLRPSGLFQTAAALPDDAFLRAAWTETALGLNRLIRVYALAEKPRYDEIDAMTRAPTDPLFRRSVVEALQAETDTPPAAFYQPWSSFALDLLVLNQRDEAIRYEPLETGENAAAFARARKIDWKAARYAAIIVPGAGTEASEVGLSPVGALRVRLAVRRWREGLAPYILVSGGHVHPNRTPFNEAVEMKRALVGQYGVPADAVIVDPYARHTTTNLRNAVRVLFRMGAPTEKPDLIVTSQDQSANIGSPAFADRCAKELGYQPMTPGERLSPFDLVARPNLASLHVDPQDPLDP